MQAGVNMWRVADGMSATTVDQVSQRPRRGVEMTLLEHELHKYHYISDKLCTLHDSQ